MDNRTKREKLEAMANQAASPQEAAIARKKLNELDAKEPPKFQYTVNMDPLDDVVFRYTINGVEHKITRRDILNGAVPPMQTYNNNYYPPSPSGYRTNVVFTTFTMSYSGTPFTASPFTTSNPARPSFRFRSSK